MWIYTAYNLGVIEISQLLCIFQSTIYRYIELFEQSGDTKPKSYQHRPPKLLGDLEQILLLTLILDFTSVRYRWRYLISLVSPWAYHCYQLHAKWWLLSERYDTSRPQLLVPLFGYSCGISQGYSQCILGWRKCGWKAERVWNFYEKLPLTSFATIQLGELTLLVLLN